MDMKRWRNKWIGTPPGVDSGSGDRCPFVQDETIVHDRTLADSFPS